jgi:hypothetical protein
MPIALENDFYVTHDLAHVSCLGIDTFRLNECVAKATAQRMKGVFGHPSYGFKGQDLGFLRELPWIEAVWFWDVDIKDIDALYAVQELQFFGVHPKRPAIDFSSFVKLRKAVIHPRPCDHGMRSLKQLELLHVWHYRPKRKDFSQLEFPESLRELQVNWANASSLESLPALPELRRFEVHRCRNLRYLGDLGAKFPRLEHLVVAACGRVDPGEGERVVRTLSHLKHAYVRDAKLV